MFFPTDYILISISRIHYKIDFPRLYLNFLYLESRKIWVLYTFEWSNGNHIEKIWGYVSIGLCEFHQLHSNLRSADIDDELHQKTIFTNIHCVVCIWRSIVIHIDTTLLEEWNITRIKEVKTIMSGDSVEKDGNFLFVAKPVLFFLACFFVLVTICYGFSIFVLGNLNFIILGVSLWNYSISNHNHAE